MKSLRNRLLNRLGVPTEPEHVEKASRRERWKRQAWMTASTLLCLSGAFAVNGVLIRIVGVNWLMVAIGAVTVVAAFYVDMKYVFPWGFDRFDLVAPWQFRDPEVEEND